MSTPPPLTSQVSIDSGQNTLEPQQKKKTAVINADPINVVTVELAGSSGIGRPPLLSSIRKDEAIVTRRELWSYYRQSPFFFLLEFRCFISKFLSKYTTTEIMYVNLSCSLKLAQNPFK